MLRRIAALSAVFIVFCSPAFSSPILYTEFASLSGTIGTTSFTNALTQFTQFSDTALVTAIGPGTYSNTGGFTVVSITGVGTATILSSSFGALALYASPNEEVGFADGGTFFTFAEYGPSAPGYDLRSSTGPLLGVLVTNTSASVNTTLGQLSLTSQSFSGFSSFSAQTTPEPSSLVFTGTGLLSLAGLLRRRMTARK